MHYNLSTLVKLYVKQKHLGCKKVRGQSGAQADAIQNFDITKTKKLLYQNI